MWLGYQVSCPLRRAAVLGPCPAAAPAATYDNPAQSDEKEGGNFGKLKKKNKNVTSAGMTHLVVFVCIQVQ